MRQVWLWRGLVAVALPMALAVGCAKQTETQPQATTPSPAPPTTTKEQPKVANEDPVAAARKLGTPSDKPVVKTASGLQYIDVKEGSGEPAKAGDTVKMQYAGWLLEGTEFDSSAKHGGQPFVFPLGAGRVIPGWDEGVAGMKPGGVRKLIVPPQLGYGLNGYPPVIPPNATLIFEVTYLGKQ